MSRNLIPEYVIAKVGGRFKLSTLLQKRMQQLNRGAPRLVDIDSDDPMKIALAELMAEKIKLIEATAEVVPVELPPPAPAEAEAGEEGEEPTVDLDLALDDEDEE